MSKVALEVWCHSSMYERGKCGCMDAQVDGTTYGRTCGRTCGQGGGDNGELRSCWARREWGQWAVGSQEWGRVVSVFSLNSQVQGNIISSSVNRVRPSVCSLIRPLFSLLARPRFRQTQSNIMFFGVKKTGSTKTIILIAFACSLKAASSSKTVIRPAPYQSLAQPNQV